MKKEFIADIMVALIFMMLLYASFSKYVDFAGYQRAMHNQPFPSWFSDALVFVLPPMEIIVAILLAIDKTKVTGLKATVGLMTAFTLYIVAILLHLFPMVPCTCGGIIRLMSWPQHLLFNLFFIAIAIIALKITVENQPNKSYQIRSSQ
ncbi:hypothetical protein SNE25_13285 [Mucilaginibacter sabulilitoris]|uniref:Methylamine utilisation protein MauE domain-containing protein n=1 Tax=Mucilaginibacter sabulilitoris TaxID=1173583 RepID=A0ABZ0TTQ9_9SPHI|nr:MauE/DoxX family redox-associated membrane protein [Mucilaginibacter sabulilitoris]WPU96494.1 hypothetical protein SNE25_13285 [Mucilaginibacter sabulilitoris]